ncbi:MAG: hypothetical protein ABI268_09315, partial [Rhodanobacter sp.]
HSFSAHVNMDAAAAHKVAMTDGLFNGRTAVLAEATQVRGDHGSTSCPCANSENRDTPSPQ